MNIISSFLQRCYFKLKSHILSERNIAILFVIVMFCVTMPMFIIGAFSHPSADDYTFCFYTYHAAKNSAGMDVFFNVLIGAFKAVKDAYLQWSGYYTGSLLAALRPNFYNENLAFFNSFILLGGFIGGIYYAMQKLLHGLWGISRYISCTISCIIVIVAIQLVPSASETFYWYTAGITYTLLFAGALVLMANILTGAYKKEMSRGGFIGNVILAFIVAGGILPVNIPTLGILTLVVIDAISRRGLCTDKKVRNKILVIYGVFWGGILIGSFSPSTFWRLNNLGEQNSVSLLYAIVYSIYGSVSTILGFLTPYVLIAMLTIIIITVFCLQNVQFEFKHPFFMTFLAWCVMFGAYFPIYYGTGFKLQYADSRYNSVLFFHFVIWIGILTVYWTGWLYRKMKNNQVRVLATGAFCVILLLATIAREERREPWSINIIKNFADGTVQQYDREMDARYLDYLDSDQPVITITRPSAIPYCIFQTEPEEGTWAITALERYFEKEKIIVE